MGTIGNTDSYMSKEVFVDGDGDLVIQHGDESVVMDKAQAQQLMHLLQAYLNTGEVA